MYIDPSAATIPSYTGGLLGHAPSAYLAWIALAHSTLGICGSAIAPFVVEILVIHNNWQPTDGICLLGTNKRKRHCTQAA